MSKKIVFAAGLVLAFAGVAQAQSLSCTCDSNAVRLDTVALQSVLSNKMVCANVGSETWQEWHNGGLSGPLVDYKLGPGNPVDPSTTVGNYVINSNSTVTYNYNGGGGSYTYEVCATNGGNYLYCGSPYGGRNIPGARIGGSGLQSCTGVASSAIVRSTATTTKR